MLFLDLQKSYNPGYQRKKKDGSLVQVMPFYDKRVKKGTQHAPEHAHALGHLSAEDRDRFNRMHQEQHFLHHYHGHELRKRIHERKLDIAKLRQNAEQEQDSKTKTKLLNQLRGLHADHLRDQRELDDVSAKVLGIGLLKDRLVAGSGGIADSTDASHQHYVEKLGQKWKASPVQKRVRGKKSERGAGIAVRIPMGPDDEPARGGSGGAEPGQPYLRDGIKVSRSGLAQFYSGTDLIPGDISAHLRPHARDSVNQAFARYDQGESSFLCADGTGAGKTRQALAVAEMQRRRAPEQSVLIVTENARIIKNAFEADAATMGIKITPIKSAEEMDGPGIYVTTYTTVGAGKVDQASFPTVIMDEAHNLKNYTTKKSKFGVSLLRKAKRSFLLTATPGDKHEHLGYLAAAFNLDFLKLIDALGYVKGKYGYERKRGLSTLDAAFRLGSFFDDMTREGMMVKREVSMDRLDVGFKEIQLKPDDQAAFDAMHQRLLRKANAAPLSERGLAKMQMLNNLRLALEPMKIPATVEATLQEHAAGKKVVIFANRVNDSDLEEDADASEGTLEALARQLEEQGLTVGKVFGKHLKTAEKTIAGFQQGKTDVVIATPQGGGTGVNLDDTVGDKPRSMLIMTPPFSSLNAVQMLGRVMRLTTKGRASARFIQAKGVEVDEWGFGIIKAKMQALGAMVAGDVQKLDLEKLRFASDTDLADLDLNNVPVNQGPEIHTADFKRRAAPSSVSATPPSQPTGARVNLRVPYADKELAKQHGARFDPAQKVWYVHGEVPAALQRYLGAPMAEWNGEEYPVLWSGTTRSGDKMAKLKTSYGEKWVHLRDLVMKSLHKVLLFFPDRAYP